jgi:hypothetical protein
LREQSEILGEAELAVLKSGLETGPEVAAKYPAQHREGEKEARAGWDPVGVMERQPTGGDDTMDMGMKLELLIPGMQHAEEADLGPEMSGRARDLEEGVGTGAEQQMVDHSLVVESQSCQLRRLGEDHMDVGAGEQFPTPCLQPVFPGPGLTFGAMAITTAVVGDGGAVSAAGTFIDMSAEGGGATARNGQQDFAVSPADPVAAALEESGSGRADQVGHLQGRPSHLCLRLGLASQQK